MPGSPFYFDYYTGALTVRPACAAELPCPQVGPRHLHGHARSRSATGGLRRCSSNHRRRLSHKANGTGVYRGGQGTRSSARQAKLGLRFLEQRRAGTARRQVRPPKVRWFVRINRWGWPTVHVDTLRGSEAVDQPRGPRPLRRDELDDLRRVRGSGVPRDHDRPGHPGPDEREPHPYSSRRRRPIDDSNRLRRGT